MLMAAAVCVAGGVLSQVMAPETAGTGLRIGHESVTVRIRGSGA
jgi:putative MFS transporter